jgi:uncharacterized protein YbcI
MDAVRSVVDQFGAASPPATGMLADICGEAAAAFKQVWGRGPARISARWAAPDMLVLPLHNGQTEAEKTLRAAGHNEQLLEARRLLQVAIEEELKSIVQRATGRCVLTVLSAARLDPDLSAEIFLLCETSPPREPWQIERARQAGSDAADAGDQARAVMAQARQVHARNESRRATTSRSRP